MDTKREKWMQDKWRLQRYGKVKLCEISTQEKGQLKRRTNEGIKNYENVKIIMKTVSLKLLGLENKIRWFW